MLVHPFCPCLPFVRTKERRTKTHSCYGCRTVNSISIIPITVHLLWYKSKVLWRILCQLLHLYLLCHLLLAPNNDFSIVSNLLLDTMFTAMVWLIAIHPWSCWHICKTKECQEFAWDCHQWDQVLPRCTGCGFGCVVHRLKWWISQDAPSSPWLVPMDRSGGVLGPSGGLI